MKNPPILFEIYFLFFSGLKKLRWFFAILFLIGLIFIGTKIGFQDNTNSFIHRYFLSYLNMPINAAANWLTDVNEYFGLRGRLHILELENSQLKTKVLELKLAEQENSELRKLLKLKELRSFDFVTAKVLGQSDGLFDRFLLINLGSEDNIQKGQIVTFGDILVGRIVEVGANSSKVMKLDDLESRIPATSLGSKTKAIIAGNNESYLEATYLPEDSEVQMSELFYTNSDNNYFPEGLIIGQVSKITRDAVYILPAVNYNSLSYVNVLVSR